MTNTAPAPEKDLRRYLLGEVSDEERANLEQKYFADDDLFEQVVEAHNDLVDSYLESELTEAERKLFEERILTTESGAERVKFARALQARTAVRSAQVHYIGGGVRRFAIAASVAFVLLTGGWLIFSREQANQPPLAESRQPAPQQSPATAPLQVEKEPPPLDRTTSQETPAAAIARDTAVLTVLLTPGSTRDADASTPLTLRTAPETVRVELVLEKDRFDSYAAELQDVEGRVLWKEESLRAKSAASGRTVALSVPARLLPPGDYVVILQGLRSDTKLEINNYNFTVAALPARR